jgi:hypothetical protein
VSPANRTSEIEETVMSYVLPRPHKLGGGALVASGVLFVVLALLDLQVGPPPSNGSGILAWRESHAIALAFVSELLFFATILLVPATIALYQSLVDIDRTKASTGCGIIALTIPVMSVLLVIHGRLIYPIYGMRVDAPEIAAFVTTVFYGGLHAVYLLLAVATFILSLAMTRGAYPKWIAYSGFATAAIDIIGSYPWAIGPIGTLICELVFAAWFVVVGLHLFGRRRAGVQSSSQLGASHGFGMIRHGLPVDTRTERFEDWLRFHGLLTPPQ